MNFLKRHWFPILLLILFSTFTIIDHTIMRRKIEEVKQKNNQEWIEYSLDWNRMLSRKQELVIDKLYEKGIIKFGTYTQKALDRENKIWLKRQMSKRNKKANSRD